MNLKSLEQLLQPGQGALVLSEENRAYFTGFHSSDGYLLVTGSGSLFLTDSRYIEDAQATITDCRVELQTKPYEQLSTFAAGKACGELLVESDRITLGQMQFFRTEMPGLHWDTSSRLSTLVTSLRSKKEPAEVVFLKKAQAIAEQSFLETIPLIKEGVLEQDIALELDYRMRKNGASGSSFDTIVVSGENASKPHGVPGMRRIKNGDFITIDFGAVYGGYCSDTTRTIAFGTPTKKMKHVYQTVLEAQRTAASAVQAGMTAKAYDKVARDIISAAGYGPFFGHSLGHGVGVEIHEAPFCGPHSKDTLEVGNVISCEPGIYLPGEFGVRIEDVLMIQETGAYNFCSLEKELLIL